MLAADIALHIFGAVGHVAIWVSLFNRIQAFGMERWLAKLQEKLCILLCGVIGILFYWTCLIDGFSLVEHLLDQDQFWRPLWYLVPCWAFGFLVFPAWLARKWENRRPKQLIDVKSEFYDVPKEVGQSLRGEGKEAFLVSLPYNQTTQLEVATKTIQLARWPSELSGLKIAHLSDLHFTGYIRREFFEFACGRINELNPDLVILTGDILDKPRCLNWIESTLGKLSAPHGVHYVLGNHDRMHQTDLREEISNLLNRSGLNALGGAWQTLDLDGAKLILAGNESPWFPPPPDMTDSPSRENGPPRILAAHTPDVFPWAKQHDFDLMLAGHTHGGQIRLPIYGPVISPSFYGVTYSAGEFCFDHLFMHVSRGLSGQHPIRYNCPPEVSLLIVESEN